MDVHRRFVQSDEGFAVLLKRWKRGDFGSCSCWRCSGTHFLPVGLDTIPGVSSVKLFCPCCKEIYNPPAPYNALDGAFFGREIPSRFLSGYSGLVEEPKPAYRPAIFGFIIHPSSPYYQNATRKGAK
ncbi:casein kinase 2, beta polypeptide [Blastocystis sp. ATCC 50177/Nand II]|uniref:Casein kinase II subunit beta n=1 Tax=Blastocystis sp. subtype 1 (strain ATCC 50177 / NandII) TaxID=478820 RepID=A0A196SPC2_BLAHN|nr:casein kinase 2, beta polypeptide [Blastocystis sp. ATCC 50177/Nand II]